VIRIEAPALAQCSGVVGPVLVLLLPSSAWALPTWNGRWWVVVGSSPDPEYILMGH
jgi:hypothetical protein